MAAQRRRGDSDSSGARLRYFAGCEARAIAERYIIPDAHLHLNVLDDTLKRNLQRSIEAHICPRDLFDEAQEVVYNHMNTECWDDFLSSSECRRVMQKVLQQETIRSRLISSGMMERVLR